jgi:ketosteroid isomerase-like protein
LGELVLEGVVAHAARNRLQNGEHQPESREEVTMKWARTVFLMPLLGGYGCTPPAQVPSTAQWDDTAAQDVRKQVETTLNAFAAMDREGFMAALTEDIVGYDIDLDGKPVRLGSLDEAVGYFDEMSGQVKKMGGTMKIDYHSNRCRATSTLASCMVEFDFLATMADGKTVSQPSRLTAVLRKGNDGWKWTHWHTSLAVLPAPPQPAAASPAPK